MSRDKVVSGSTSVSISAAEYVAGAAKLDWYEKREQLVLELLEAADELGDELYPIMQDHDYNMRQNFVAAKRVRDFKVTP